MKKFFVSLFLDEVGNVSSKRVCGVLCIVSLCVTMFANQFTPEHIKPSDTLVNTVGLLAFGCLGLTSVDKYTKKIRSCPVRQPPPSNDV